MRSFVFATAFAILTGWLAVEYLPEEAIADPVRASRPQEVQGVALDGRGLPLASLRQLLDTRPGQLVAADSLARDRAALEAELVARGFLAAKVNEAKVVYDAAGAAFVTFAITQGPQFRVRSVKVTGASALDAGVVTLTAGELVMSDRLAHARDALARRLAARGLATVVEVKLARDEAAAVVDVELVAR